MNMLSWVVVGVLVFVAGFSVPDVRGVYAEEGYQEEYQGQAISEVVRARVSEVVSERAEAIPGTEVTRTVQELRVNVRDGVHAGKEVTVQNDFVTLTVGDKIFIIHQQDVGGESVYFVQDIDRRASLTFFILLFCVSVIALGGWYGVRALASLVLSLLVLAYVLVPGLVSGWNPLFACFVVSAAILAGAIFFTHGFNRESVVCFVGTLLAVTCTLGIAVWAVSWTSLSGFSAQESVYLNFNTEGALNLIGLLIGGIVIGALGVLDDIAITQVAVVREILRGGRYTSRWEVFVRAMRVGREHVGAVVNTLALAYVGVSLPLVLLMYLGQSDASAIYNMEIVAVEIVRIMVGSMGIVLAVPIVTALATRYLRAEDGGAHAMRGCAHASH